MANKITELCVNCGACEPVCPSGGISRGDDVFVIDADSCTECVGFFHTQQCARVCPVDACIIDPDNVESEAVLFARAERLHATTGRMPTLGPETSHYRAWERTLGSKLRALGRRLSEAVQGFDQSA